MADTDKATSKPRTKRIKAKSKKNAKRENDGARNPYEAPPPKEIKPDRATSKSMRKYRRNSSRKPSKKALGDNKKAAGRVNKALAAEKQAAYDAARAEILLTETGGYLEADEAERTFRFTQDQLAEHIDEASCRKIFNLDLDQLGPYAIRYSNNGRHLLLGGRKGHVGTFDWQTGGLRCELQLRETVRDVQFLHNERLFAVAQKRHVYLYDASGAEINFLAKHIDPLRLEFLPYHFLLVSIGNAGYLKYHDVSTGKLVAELKTKSGPCHAMRHNRRNAIIHCGHTNGTVTLWSPNMSTPVVKQLCHRGPINGLAVDHDGGCMTTIGTDSAMKVWDIRKFQDKPVYEYQLPVAGGTIDISQRNMVAVTCNSLVQIWKPLHLQQQHSPYMTHRVPGATLRDVRFCPYEDVLGIGHSKGFSSIVVPGSGISNFDSFEANPFQTSKQRKEAEVKQLLDKIPSELIALDPNAVVKVDSRAPSIKAAERKAEMEDETFVPRHRKRGRSSTMRRYLRKQKNVIDGRREAIKERLAKEKEARQAAQSNEPQERSALDRFK